MGRLLPTVPLGVTVGPGPRRNPGRHPTTIRNPNLVPSELTRLSGLGYGVRSDKVRSTIISVSNHRKTTVS